MTSRQSNQDDANEDSEDMTSRPSGLKQCGSKTGYRGILFRRRSLIRPDDPKSLKTLPHIGECILSGLETLWKQKQMTDVVVVAETKTYLAHKLVLASCSDFFYEKFTLGKEAEAEMVEVRDVKATALQAILECMYTGKIQLTEWNVRDILSAASTLGFLGVHDACEEYLKERLDVDNCLSFLNIGVVHDLDSLTENAFGVAAKNFEHLSKRPEFKQVPVEQLISLMSRDDVVARSELVIFGNVLDWIEHDRQRRIEFAPDLLRTVRLPLLSPSEIVDKVESVGFIMDVPDCQRLAKEALHYHCMPARQALLQTPRTIPRTPAIRNCLVTVGGAPRLKSDPVCDEISMYDDVNGSWELAARLPEPRHHHAVAVLHGFLYVVGGEMNNDHCSPVNTAFRFDPRHGNWLQIASMKDKRESFQIGVLHGKLYAVGGRVDKTESLSSVERYNPSTDEWEDVAPIFAAKRSVAVATMQGKLYAVGGSGKKFISSRVERYHPSENAWEVRSPLLTPRFFAHLRHVGGALYLIGGATMSPEGVVVCTDTIEQYASNTDTWNIINRMRTPRAEFGSAVVGTKIFILGGYCWDTKKRLNSVEALDVQTRLWKEGPSLHRQYTGLACTSLTMYKLNRISSPAPS